MESISILKMLIICIKGDFHQWILGILASRIMAEYNKPSIIFAKTDNGTYKASGRSVEGLDLHGIIGKYAYLCEHFGGHKMAIGLEIKVERFDEFVSLISNETINALNNLKQNDLSKNDYIIIKEKDINADFISQLNLLAPFGCDNEKPIFSLNVNAPINVERLGAKDSPHLKLNLGGGSNIVYFYGLQHKNLLLSPAKKQLILDIDFNYFKNKAIPQAIVKNINILEPIGLELVEQFDCMNAFYLSKSILNGINNNNIEKKLINLKDDLIKLNEFGTLIFACTNSSFETLKGLKLDVKITDQIPANKQTAIIINSYLPFDTNTLIGYKNLVFLDDYYNNQFDFLTKYKVFTYGKITNRFKVEDERYKCGLIFSILKSGKLDNKFTNIVDLCLKIKNLLPFLKANEICICLLALEELEIISINNLDNLILKINETSSKKNLENSKILNYFRG